MDLSIFILSFHVNELLIFEHFVKMNVRISKLIANCVTKIYSFVFGFCEIP